MLSLAAVAALCAAVPSPPTRNIAWDDSELARREMIAEIHRVDDARPSLGGPVALLSMGWAVFFSEVGVDLFSLLGGPASWLVIGVTGLAVGLHAGGLAWLLAVVVRTVRADAEVRGVNAQLERLKSADVRPIASSDAPLPSIVLGAF